MAGLGSALDAVVVVPARDEASRIAACLRALAAQSLPTTAFEIVLVLDGCTDDTGEVAAAAAERLELTLTRVLGPGRGSGPARRTGMDLACDRLLAAGRPDGLIASTDADSRPERDWLARQLAHLAAGCEVVAGRIELEEAEARRLPAAVIEARERDAAARLREVRRVDPDAAHHHFAGASLGIAATTYRRVGGIEPLPFLEDDAFLGRLAEHAVPVLRAPDVTVVTSARTDGRVARGLAADLALADWLARRRFAAHDFSVERTRRAKGERTVTVIVPVKECADTITGVLETTVGPALRAGLVDELVVVDAASGDGSARLAAAAGARVVQQDELAAALGPAQGKGDAMWRGLLATTGELVCFLDGDTRDPDPAHLVGLLGPLFTEPALTLVKGAFDRPLDAGDRLLPHEGGRVTELMARPALNLYAPLLSGFSQPLAGEFAAHRWLLESVPFPVGYGVEIAILLDALRLCGLEALGESALGTRQNRHQPLRALGEMAYAVLCALARRLPNEEASAQTQPPGRLLQPWSETRYAAVPVAERPPASEWSRRQAPERA